MFKPFVIVQLRPEDLTSDNEYESLLKYGGLTEDQTYRIRAEQNGLPALNLDDYSGLIVGGSPFDVTSPEYKKSEIQKLLEQQFNDLFEEIIARDYPFLGACSGNGLLGNYLGTPMSRKYAEPVCSRIVEVTEEGKKDPLLDGFPDEIDVMLGHKEACDEVPQNATLLVRGKECPVQMFRVKNNVYATQFHPEGDAEGFILRVDVYANHGYFDPLHAEELKTELAKSYSPHSQEILRRFVTRYQVPQN